MPALAGFHYVRLWRIITMKKLLLALPLITMSAFASPAEAHGGHGYGHGHGAQYGPHRHRGCYWHGPGKVHGVWHDYYHKHCIKSRRRRHHHHNQEPVIIPYIEFNF